MTVSTLVRTALIAFAVCAPAVADTPSTNETAAGTALTVGSLFQEHMVLQRERPVKIWGTAAPGETVTIRFAGQVKQATADVKGGWSAELDPLVASAEGRELTIEGSGGSRIVVADVLVGEVWLASGQSNMGITVMGAMNRDREVPAADYPKMRFFPVPTRATFEPCATVEGQWLVVSPKTVPQMSAVAYAFAREVHRKLNVPVGVIVSAVAGSAAETWTPREILAADPEWNAALEQIDAATRHNETLLTTFTDTLAAWRTANKCPEQPAKTEWANVELDTSDWKPASGRFAIGKTAGLSSGGVIWLRKEFEVPEAKAGKPASLWIDQLDRQILTLFINGKEFATLGLSPPRFYQGGLMSVPVPAGIVTAGRNVVAIRCTTFSPDTTKMFAAPRMRLPVADPAAVDDQWLVKAEAAFPAFSAEAVAALPVFGTSQTNHAGFYNGMIHPLLPYTIRGAIWYQGESNILAFDRYHDLLSAMIGAWRARWGQGDFPFYFVQLANHYAAPPQPAATDRINPDDTLARLREAQLQVAETVPETGMAVTIDIGGKTIHPENKQDVGDRLARIALAKTYGQADVAYQSPRYDSMTKEGSAIRVKFKDCPGGLMVAAKSGLEPAQETPGAPLQQFAIAGDDNKFVWADANIEGDTVVVSSPQVPNPVAVRYAWAQNPEGRNLYGKNGLPAAPFRTDAIPAPSKPVSTR